jgi:hypothetical protein
MACASKCLAPALGSLTSAAFVQLIEDDQKQIYVSALLLSGSARCQHNVLMLVVTLTDLAILSSVRGSSQEPSGHYD